MNKCHRTKKEKNSEVYGFWGKIQKMMSESFIKFLVTIFWICVLWICASICYHIFLIIWFMLFLPDNPLTKYFIWLPFGMLLKYPIILLPVCIASMIGTVFYILWKYIDPIAWGIAAIVLWPIHPILRAMNDEGIWTLFNALFDDKLPFHKKMKKIVMASPFFRINQNNDDNQQELTIDDIIGCNEIDTGLFKALMNLFILKKDGVYVNNMAKLRIAEDKKVKEAKNMVKITNEPNRLTEQQRANIERCISQSVKTNANKSNIVDTLENMYKNEIIKNNCVKKYDGSNRKLSDPNVDNMKVFMEKMQKSSESANKTMKQILNNDIDM